MRANAWEGIGKELKIKGKFYVSSRDVRIVYSWLMCERKFSSTSSILDSLLRMVVREVQTLHFNIALRDK
jgi:hypothetical protein